MNLLYNPSFELGWTDVDGIQVPKGYHFWYAGPELNWIDPADHSKFSKPENWHFQEDSNIKEGEWELFSWHGDWALKISAPKWKTTWCALDQYVPLDLGTYRLTINLFSDFIDHYEDEEKIAAPDPQSGMMRFVIDDIFAPWFPMIPFLERHTYIYDFVASGNVDVGAQWVFPHPLEGNAIFTDAWSLEKIELDEPECRGVPPREYKRIYNVLPQNATIEQAKAVLEATFDKKQTIGFSSDDAGIGDLDDKTAVEWGRKEKEKQDYREFYETDYPKTEVEFKPFPGEPAPPDYTLATLHLQTPVENWLAAVESGNQEKIDEAAELIERDGNQFNALVAPGGFVSGLANAGIPLRCVKLVGSGMERAARIKEVSPETLVVYRHHLQDQAPYLNDPNPYNAANRYLDLFWEGIENNPDIGAVESLNETIATNDLDGLRKTKNFDSAFADLVNTRSQGKVVPVTLTAAVGNPQHGAQVEMLIPAVEATIDAGGFLGPHTYFPCDFERVEHWFETEGRDYHLRPFEWDKTFAKYGLEPSYFFGEAGAVTATVREDGRPGSLNSGGGWRGCLGSLPRYIDLLLYYQEMLRAWNEQNNGRCFGFAIFTTGIGIGWDQFLFNAYELSEFQKALIG